MATQRRRQDFSVMYDSLAETEEFQGMKRCSLRKYITTNFKRQLKEIADGNGSAQLLMHCARSMRADQLARAKSKASSIVIRSELLPGSITVTAVNAPARKSLHKIGDTINKLKQKWKDTTFTYE